MFDRRTVFKATTSVAAFVGALVSGATRSPKANTTATAQGFPGDIDPRGTTGRLERLPALDLEGQQDFLIGLRAKVNSDFERAAFTRSREILEENGLDIYGEYPMEQVVKLFEDDPVIGTKTRMWTSSQLLTWHTLRDHFYEHADSYLAEMEAADSAGPGTLELNPDMDIPKYTTHEIHMQPGGYVGDPFAGHVYHYGTNMFFAGRNNQDELHIDHAKSVAVPKDGQVKRVLEFGCGSGQLTVATKERFPDADVWGIDIGGPMVRYAHMRAVDLGVDVNFAQRLAEDSKFPDNHFDIVYSHLFYHEMTKAASEAAIAEAHRILRPGGVIFPIDLWVRDERPGRQAYQKYNYWFNHRWNDEVWFMEYAELDLEGTMQKVGFEVPPRGKRTGFFEDLVGYKKA